MSKTSIKPEFPIGSRVSVLVCLECHRYGSGSIRHVRRCSKQEVVEYVAQIMGAKSGV